MSSREHHRVDRHRRTRFSLAPGPAQAGGLALYGIWDVEAYATYDVRWGARGKRCQIAVRTLAGTGRIHVDCGSPIEVTADTLVLLEALRVRRYCCVGPLWRFRWFEFSLHAPLHMPRYRLLHMPPARGEEERFRTMFAALRHEFWTDRSTAAAGFLWLLYEWQARFQLGVRREPRRARLQQLIDALHEDLSRPWTVEAMAKVAHMSVRNLRRAFRAATGRSPKQYGHAVRMSAAQELLRLGTYTVKEVAAQLGYSSAFYFSRLFRAEFGYPPSQYGTRGRWAADSTR
ncbi:MAG: helix-turn-helix transcriptional regulator [Kiritimatiellae bacterium]|nr:helix-turn-helix transcriptional regulator [Kiritimatiellia bacterium]